MFTITITNKHHHERNIETIIPNWLWAGISDRAKAENASWCMVIRRAIKCY